MKHFFKLTTTSIALLTLTASVYAASPHYDPAWSSQLSGAFVGGEGLDLQAQNGDTDYYLLSPIAGGDFRNHKVGTIYNWNWRVYGGVHFTENDDITLSWLQFRENNTSSVVDVTATPRWLAEDDWDNIVGRVVFDLDEVYAVWGHTVNLNQSLAMRYGAGVDYVNLNSKLEIIENILTEGVNNIGFESKSKLSGIGPRVELGLTYQLPHCFSLFANTNAALLISKRHLTLTPINDTPGVILFTADYADRHIVIPKVGVKLGANYTFSVGQAGAEGALCRSTKITLSLGWQAESYIHAVERPNDSNVNPGIDFNATKTSNFGDQGFFAGLQFSSDWL